MNPKVSKVSCKVIAFLSKPCSMATRILKTGSRYTLIPVGSYGLGKTPRLFLMEVLYYVFFDRIDINYSQVFTFPPPVFIGALE